MSARMERIKRDYQKHEYFANLCLWADGEPPRWRFIRYRRWKRARPEPEEPRLYRWLNNVKGGEKNGPA